MSFSHFSFYLCDFILYILFDHCWKEPEEKNCIACFVVALPAGQRLIKVIN